ncbi:hypothetical protein HJG60_010936 [Phyllostomus discolor]|uniref:Uncharacterized protein n=1 Tax=Phyllostomus discolor TaxID=89673 RepID=A0A834EAC3_9CHIR|nr:hypothetical protein HJG60_010936 [Phyllostomus discolor]
MWGGHNQQSPGFFGQLVSEAQSLADSPTPIWFSVPHAWEFWIMRRHWTLLLEKQFGSGIIIKKYMSFHSQLDSFTLSCMLRASSQVQKNIQLHIPALLTLHTIQVFFKRLYTYETYLTMTLSTISRSFSLTNAMLLPSVH